MAAKIAPAKLADVALWAGVSTATVSRVLTGKAHVSEEVRRRVRAAVDELNFRPSRLARSLQAHGIAPNPELLYVGPPTMATGYQFADELLAVSQPPTALFLGNNLLTIGALKAIHEHDLRIPNDIALVAFDEMDWMFVMKLALTVAAQPVYEMGRVAAELLLARIADRTRAAQEIVLQPTVYIRQSCAHHQAPSGQHN